MIDKVLRFLLDLAQDSSVGQEAMDHAYQFAADQLAEALGPDLENLAGEVLEQVGVRLQEATPDEDG